MLNEHDIQRNLKAVDNAIAQQRLEGLDVPMDVIADLKRAARGEIHIADGIQTTYQKFVHGEVRRARSLS